MFLQADFEQEEVDSPFNHWCASGHHAPLLFRREGAGAPEMPTKFYLVKGKNINGIYCELCLIFAHWKAKQDKNIIK